MRATRLTALAAAVLFTAATAACGGDSGTTTTDAAAPAANPATSSAAPPSADAGAGTFGPGCAGVPTDAANPGSFSAMAMQPVATAASGNPLLKTLVSAVKQAGLVDSLNSAQALTVFAPTDDAFAKIPAADLKKVLADKKTLTEILTYHAVPRKLAPQELAGTHETLQGGSVTVTGGGEDFTVAGTSTVVCGNVQTANATVYVVDTVLMPEK